MALELRVWWAALSFVVSVNLVVWWQVARAAQLERTRQDEAAYARLRMHVLLSGVYALVCAIRGILPRADVQRMCLVDSAYSSVFIGRTLATVAELCFALQWALLLRHLADATRTRSAGIISGLLVPMIVWAEIASWYAVVTTNFLGNVVEQSTWTLAGALICVAYIRIYPQAAPVTRRFLRRTSGVLVAFLWFMCTVDIPHYLARWSEDQSAGKQYLAWQVGLLDSARRWTVVNEWDPWRPEVAWMSLYFSVGVWTSLSFARAALWTSPAAGAAATADARSSVPTF